MNEQLRNPQIINGEMHPRNHYIGLESVRKLHELVKYLKTQGVNLMAIPIINEVEAGVRDESLEKGTIVGAATTELEGKDLAQILAWDGTSIIGVSLLMYLHKAANGWRIPGELGYEKPDFGSVIRDNGTQNQQPEKTRETRKKKPSSTSRRREKNKKIRRRDSFY